MVDFKELREECIEKGLNFLDEVMEVRGEEENLEYLLENDPEELVNIAREREDLREEIAEMLAREELYELACGVVDNVAIWGEFAAKFPLDALIHSTYYERDDLDCLIDRCFDVLLGDREGYETCQKIHSAYATLVDNYDYGLAQALIEDSLDLLVEYNAYWEIHFKALEAEDERTLGMLARVIAKENTREALLLAEEAGDYELVEGIVGDPQEVGEYDGMIGLAHSLIGMVQGEFGGEFPGMVRPGGPEGSYATITYKKFGRQYNAA
tara:strand:+ start:612 stop:1415 length:804 start_codon:yes stop_codon:yes gene_type:complete